MAEYSHPWDKDLSGDKGPYEATFFARKLNVHNHRDGIYPRDNDGSNTCLQVKQQTVADMTVRVAKGAAFLKGNALEKAHEYYNDDFINLDIDDNVSGNPRIDRVVLRLNYAAQTVRLAVKTGTPAGSPSAPSLQQDGTYWEIALAQVAVANGALSIVTADITMEASNAILLPAVEGGTGLDAFAAGQIPVASAANTLAALAAPANYSKLLSNTGLAQKMAWVGDIRTCALRGNGGGAIGTSPSIVPFASADKLDPGGILTVASNQFSLPAGTYRVTGFISMTSDAVLPYQFWIADSSAPNTVLIATEWKNSSGAVSFPNVFLILPGEIVSTGSELFEVYGERGGSATSALYTGNTTGATPTYTPWGRQINFERIQ